MKKSKFTEEQIAYALRKWRADAPADVCRQLGVSEATSWKKKYAPGGRSAPAAVARGRERALKRLVADLSLDKHILTEALRKNVWSAPGLQVRRRS